MLSATAPNPTARIASMARRWEAWLRRAWQRLHASDDEHFLSEARDLVDLEARLRRLERGRDDRFGPLPPPP